METIIEIQEERHTILINNKKVFDNVSHQKLFTSLQTMGFLKHHIKSGYQKETFTGALSRKAKTAGIFTMQMLLELVQNRNN